ncbi:MAG TPA: hypothetical protein DHV22_08035, partial [Xanthomarina gelatinilytica]|nr:hypothetical protein [Xanthomarina gelatinilytica]
RAELHSKDTIYPFDRPLTQNHQADNSENQSDGKIDYRDAIKSIKEAGTLEALKPFDEDERKSVKAAYEKKHAELVKNLEVKQ